MMATPLKYDINATGSVLPYWLHPDPGCRARCDTLGHDVCRALIKCGGLPAVSRLVQSAAFPWSFGFTLARVSATDKPRDKVRVDMLVKDH